MLELGSRECRCFEFCIEIWLIDGIGVGVGIRWTKLDLEWSFVYSCHLF